MCDIKAVIFDLDGVLVSTDELHFIAWNKIAHEEGIYFDKYINEKLRGVSRLESLNIILKNTNKEFNEIEKMNLMTKKNNYYIELLSNLTSKDVLPGVLKLIKYLKENNIKIAVGSSSKNANIILEKIKLKDKFDAIVDGNEIKYSKPNPEVFLLAAQKLNINPINCLVIEDADAGIQAAISANMKTIGIGYAYNNINATFNQKDLLSLNINNIIKVG